MSTETGAALLSHPPCGTLHGVLPGRVDGLPTVPRLIVSDLDGTLLRSDGSIAATTVAAVRRVQQAGVTVVVATARPPRWMHDLESVLGPDCVVICSNGAFLYDVGRRMVLAEHTMLPSVVDGIVADLRTAIPGVAFARENSIGFAREDAYVDVHAAPSDTEIGPIEMLLSPPPGKLLAQAEDHPEAEFLAEVSEIVGTRAVVTYSGVGGLAEISGAGVTKATAIADFCAQRGIDSRDVWAFGDMPNDLEMMSWADTSFAVANAAPEVLTAATAVVPSNDDDGVAQQLHHLADRLHGGQPD